MIKYDPEIYKECQIYLHKGYAHAINKSAAHHMQPISYIVMGMCIAALSRNYTPSPEYRYIPCVPAAHNRSDDFSKGCVRVKFYIKKDKLPYKIISEFAEANSYTFTQAIKSLVITAMDNDYDDNLQLITPEKISQSAIISAFCAANPYFSPNTFSSDTILLDMI